MEGTENAFNFTQNDLKAMIISPVSAALNPLSIDDVLSGGRDSSSSITETSLADNISSR